MTAEILEVYGVTIVCGTLVACLLSLIGIHIVARGQSLQSICISQGAQCGASVVLFLAALAGREFAELELWQGFLGSILGAICIGWLSSISFAKDTATRVGNLIGLWLLLLSLNAIVLSSHPFLSAHQTKAFLGDLVSVTNSQSWFGIAWATVGLGIFFSFKDKWQKNSFDRSVLQKTQNIGWLEATVFIGTLVYSTWVMGFLFTSACLVLPTSMMAMMGKTKAKEHTLRSFFVTLISVPAGFLYSLEHTMVPTVPAVVISISLVSGLMSLAKILFVVLKNRSNLKS